MRQIAGNPYRYETGWTIEQHRDELIDRLGKAIKRINELENTAEPVSAPPQIPATPQEETTDAFEVYGPSAQRNGWDSAVYKTIIERLARLEDESATLRAQLEQRDRDVAQARKDTLEEACKAAEGTLLSKKWVNHTSDEGAHRAIAAIRTLAAQPASEPGAAE